MSSSLRCSTLNRLLSLNNQVYDLQNQLRHMAVPQYMVSQSPDGGEDTVQVIGHNAIAELQEDIDRELRAILTVCWLGASDELDG